MQMTVIHMNFAPAKNCKNEDVLYTCYKCNKCGRFDERCEICNKKVKPENKANTIRVEFYDVLNGIVCENCVSVVKKYGKLDRHKEKYFIPKGKDEFKQKIKNKKDEKKIGK